MANNTDVLLQFCQEEWTQARHSEEQRATMTNIILIIVSAALGFVAQKGLNFEMLSLTIPLIGLGIYGAVASEKLYERHQFHIERARSYRKRVIELNPEAQLDKYRLEGIATHEKKFPRLYRLRLHHIWLALHIAIVAIGAILTLVIIT